MVKKKDKEDYEFKKLLKKKLISKDVLKQDNMTLVVKKSEPHSILGEENKFFKHELEKEARGMFFS